MRPVRLPNKARNDARPPPGAVRFHPGCSTSAQPSVGHCADRVLDAGSGLGARAMDSTNLYWAWTRSLPMAEKLMLLAIQHAEWLDRHELAPHAGCRRHLAALTGLDERSAQQVIDRLIHLGCAIRCADDADGVARYRLALHRPDQLPGVGEPASRPAPEPSGSAPERGARPSTLLSPEQQERFDRFWAVYPRKVQKARAREVWRRIDPDDALTDRICAAVQQARRSPQWNKQNGRYIPYPTTYLNAESWTDELEPEIDARLAPPDESERARHSVANARALFDKLEQGSRHGAEDPRGDHRLPVGRVQRDDG